MLVRKPNLVTCESIVGDWAVNLIIDVSDYGLSKFCADSLSWAGGMKGKESLGGRLFVTNYRIVFVTHAFNRVVGEFSIPHEITTGVRKKTFLLIKKVAVVCTLGEFQFIMWRRDRFLALVEAQKNGLDLATWHTALRNERATLLSGNLEVSSIMENGNQLLNAFGFVRKTSEAISNPLAFLRHALLDEALDALVKDPINAFVAGRE